MGVGTELTQRRVRVLRNGSKYVPLLCQDQLKRTQLFHDAGQYRILYVLLIPAPESEREEETEYGLKETRRCINTDF